MAVRAQGWNAVLRRTIMPNIGLIVLLFGNVDCFCLVHR